MNLPATPFISVIIPNHNGEKTIGRCLEAAFASKYPSFEVVVVDDCSSDGSTTIIEKYPCRLIRLSQHGGKRGAKYFRGRSPRQVVYLETGHTRSSASRRSSSTCATTEAAS